MKGRADERVIAPTEERETTKMRVKMWKERSSIVDFLGVINPSFLR